MNSVAELVAYAKANPGPGYATSGVGTNQHILGEWFKQETGLKLNHVPYRGAGQAINDLIAGHVKIALLGPTATVPHYKAGNLRLLAQSSAKRAPYLRKSRRSRRRASRAWCWKPGTPPSCRRARRRRSSTRLNAEMAKALADPAMIESFTRGSMEPVGGTPAELGTLARADSVKYERLVRELNISSS